MTIGRLTFNGIEVPVGVDQSTCLYCNARLTLAFDEWWDDEGFIANVGDDGPWHKHAPVVDQ